MCKLIHIFKNILKTLNKSNLFSFLLIIRSLDNSKFSCSPLDFELSGVDCTNISVVAFTLIFINYIKLIIIIFAIIFLINFSVDGRGAGSGNLEILVNGGHVTSHVEEAGAQRFIASFVPHEPMSHRVEMSFNGYPVPGKHPAAPSTFSLRRFL